MANASTTTQTTEPTRRDFLFLATGAVGAVAGVAAAIPLIMTLAPDGETIAAGAPIDFDLTPVAEGQIVKLFWRGKLIFVRHRTKKEIEEARDVNVATLPDPATDQSRVKEGESQWLIVFGNCTHLGCIPLGATPGDNKGDYGGWFCPCHGSHYDTSGRIRKGPAPTNLPVPPYAFLSPTKIKIG